MAAFSSPFRLYQRREIIPPEGNMKSILIAGVSLMTSLKWAFLRFGRSKNNPANAILSSVFQTTAFECMVKDQYDVKQSGRKQE